MEHATPQPGAGRRSGRPRRPPSPPPARSREETGAAGALLALQRSAGNRAVAASLTDTVVVQRDPPTAPPAQLPQYSQSTEAQIESVMHEHPGLTRRNAERAVLGPAGTTPVAIGPGGAAHDADGNQPQAPDIDFRRPSPKGNLTELSREVKVIDGGQSSFNSSLSHAADQLQTRGGGGEVLIQVPAGRNARQLVQRFKGAVLAGEEGMAKIGRYRSITVIIVDTEGTELLNEPLELPPARIGPATTPGAPGGGAPPGGGAGGGGASGKVTAPAAEGGEGPTPSSKGPSSVPSGEEVETGSHGSFGGSSVASSIGWGLAEFVTNLLLAQLADYLGNPLEKQMMQQRWNELRPTIDASLTAAQGDLAATRQQTHDEQIVYANITLDVVTIQAGYEGAVAEGYYGMDFTPPVAFSTQDKSGEGKFTKIGPAPGGNIIHRPHYVSFPIYVPGAILRPELAKLHRDVGLADEHLRRVGGGTAGEAVAHDQLLVALQASDYTPASAFAARSNAERRAATVNALAMALSVLEGPVAANDALTSVVGHLRLVQIVVDGLKDRWPAMG